MGLCTRRIIEWLAILLVANLGHVHADCDVCQNYVACHSERVFSLCIDGIATRNYLTCPRGHVCTTDDYICYPKSEAIQTCARPYIVNASYERNHMNRCGVCNQPDKVFSCINETTIAFCFGNDTPNGEAISVCPEGMVCDLENKGGFCSKATRVQPSCVPKKVGGKETTTEIVSTPLTIRSTERPTIKRPKTDNTTSTTLKSMPTGATINSSSIKTTETNTKPTTKTTTTTKTIPTRKTIPTTKRSPTKRTTTTTKTIPTRKTIPTTKRSPTKRTTTTTKTIPTTKRTPTTKSTPKKRKTKKPSTRKTTGTTTKTVITKSPPTPSTTHKPTTTTRKPRSPETVCKEEKKKPGYFAQDADPTCTKFLSCYENVAGKLTGDERDCEDDEYFDPKTAACGKKKPKGCA